VSMNPYLFFGGRCEEAISFYQQALGAELKMKLLFKDSPDAPPPGVTVVPDQVMHAELAIGGTTLMCTDGSAGDATGFRGFGLALHLADETAVRQAFDRLAAGGQVTMPLGKTFWSPCFGMLVDRLGVSWLIGIAA
jgi:PhnB protein